MHVPDLSTWIRDGDTVAWGQMFAQPAALTEALVAQRHRLGRLRLFLGIGAGAALQPEHADAFDFCSYTGAGHRALVDAGLLQIVPSHYSTLASLLRQGPLRVDVLLLQVSPPDDAGHHSLGLAAEYLVPLLDTCRVIIGEVNPDVPWTFGERSLRAQDFALLVDANAGPESPAVAAPGETERAIGAHVAALIDDGATLQLGIGSMPDAVLAALAGHRDLGLHTGAAGDGVAALAQAGVLTNERKSIDRGVAVAGLLAGGPALRRWAHHNPRLQMRSTSYTHDSAVLARIERFTAINSALEVDLTGQVNAESVGGLYVGAIGGALDFARAAAQSRGGLPITALPATAGARSRIVATLGGPVTVPRSDAGIIVTEHGVADLRGLSLAQRIEKMISIAAPAHRTALLQAAPAVLARTSPASSSSH